MPFFVRSLSITSSIPNYLHFLDLFVCICRHLFPERLLQKLQTREMIKHVRGPFRGQRTWQTYVPMLRDHQGRCAASYMNLLTVFAK